MLKLQSACAPKNNSSNGKIFEHSSFLAECNKKMLENHDFLKVDEKPNSLIYIYIY